jgi:hypothetical protein
MSNDNSKQPLTLTEISHILGKLDVPYLAPLVRVKKHFFEKPDQDRLIDSYRKTFTPLEYLKEKCDKKWQDMTTEEQYHRITQLFRREDFPELDWRGEEFVLAHTFFAEPIIEPWRSLILYLNTRSLLPYIDPKRSNGVTTLDLQLMNIAERFIYRYFLEEKPVSFIIDDAIKNSFRNKRTTAVNRGYMFIEGQWVHVDEEEEEEEEYPIDFEISQEYMIWKKNREIAFYETLLEALTIPIGEVKLMPVQRLVQLIEILTLIYDELYDVFEKQYPRANSQEQDEVKDILERTLREAVTHAVREDSVNDTYADISKIFELTQDVERNMHDAVQFFRETAEHRIDGIIMEIEERLHREEIEEQERQHRISNRQYQKMPSNKPKGLGPAKNRAAGKVKQEPISSVMAEFEAQSPVVEKVSPYVEPEGLADAHSSFATSHAANSFSVLDEGSGAKNSGRTKKKKGKKSAPDPSKYGIKEDDFGGKKRKSTRRRKQKSRRSKKAHKKILI